MNVSALNTIDIGEMETEGRLTIKQLRFVNEYMLDSNGTQAAIRAGYSPDSAESQGSRLLSYAKVKKELAARLRQAATAAGVSSAFVISELFEVANANPNEVMELIVQPCPKCWPGPLKLEDPNPLCDRPAIVEGYNLGGCGGAGYQTLKLTPTKKLSRSAAKLISSIKQKKDGSIEIEMRSQDKAVELLGRACGVFKDRQEISGPGGGPIPVRDAPPRELTDEEITAKLAQIEASRASRALSEGTIEGTFESVRVDPPVINNLQTDVAP